jgi:hypothetical protein
MPGQRAGSWIQCVCLHAIAIEDAQWVGCNVEVDVVQLRRRRRQLRRNDTQGVRLNVPANCGIVVPHHVVVEVCLLVRILPWEPQIESETPEPARVLIGGVAAERLGLVPAPHCLCRLVGDEPRRVQVVRGTLSIADPNPYHFAAHRRSQTQQLLLERPCRQNR